MKEAVVTSSLTIVFKHSSWCASAVQLCEIFKRTVDRRAEMPGSLPKALNRTAYDLHCSTVGN
jgi:hypothetical protein